MVVVVKERDGMVTNVTHCDVSTVVAQFGNGHLLLINYYYF